MITKTSDAAVQRMREKIARFGRMLYERHLTDAAGGNLSARVGDVLCMSPRYSGSKRQWQLQPEDILVVDMERNILDGEGQISRETNVHFKLYKEFSEHGSAVIHAHAKKLLVFAALGVPLPPVLEATRKFGETPVVAYAPAHSEQLALNVYEAIRGREAVIRKHAAAVLAPWHGVFLMGKDIDAAFDAVERLDTNAYCIMMGQMLGASPLLEKERAAMETAINNFQEA